MLIRMKMVTHFPPPHYGGVSWVYVVARRCIPFAFENGRNCMQ